MFAILLSVFLGPAPAPATPSVPAAWSASAASVPSAVAVPLDLAAQQEDEASAARPARVAAGGRAQLRPFFDRKTPLLLELDAGAPLEVVRQAVPWSEVRVPGGLAVWVHGDYVAWTADGKLKPQTSRLRARPLPSTAAESHPIGKLDATWEMPVLARDGDWLQVLAPEGLAAWVLTDQIQVLDDKPAAWGLGWSAAAKKRQKALLDAAEPVTAGPEGALANAGRGDDAGGESAGDEDPTGRGKEVAREEQDDERVDVGAGEAPPAGAEPARPAEAAGGAGEPGRPAEAGGAAARVADAAAQPKPPTQVTPAQYVSVEQLQRDPAAALERARANLDVHAQEVTARLEVFRPAILENCEMVFSAVLLRAQEREPIAAARAGLTRADALRRFHTSARASALRRAEVERGLESGSLAEEESVPEQGEGVGVWVGHLVHKPHEYPETPFVATRGDREVLVHSFDGRYYLKDYLGRQIVVRGPWRAHPDRPERKVIAIQEIRVLPRAGGR